MGLHTRRIFNWFILRLVYLLSHKSVDFLFFSGKSLKFCSRSIWIFRGLACDFFKVQCISFAKRKANSTTEQKNCKGHEKHLINMNLIIRFPSEIKVLHIDPVISNWDNFNKKVSIINCYTNSKSFKAIDCFFLVFLRSLLFSNCKLALFFRKAFLKLYSIQDKQMTLF